MTSVQRWHNRFSDQAEWTAEVRDYLFTRAGLKAGQSLIEVGCGTGAILSRLPESAQRFGLDIDPAFLAHASDAAAGIPLTCADAHQMPYPSSSFNAACCHFLLLWVSEPLVVLREMARVTKPGGAVLALAEPDYGGRIDYPEALVPLGEAQTASLAAQGADPLLGRKLAELFQAAGLVDIEVGIISSQWQPPRKGTDTSEWQMLEHDLADRLTETQLSEYREIDQHAWQTGSRVLYVPTFYAIGHKVQS
ncbi:MAG: methyltransferase domain-containing protein [Chloroflexota bacterium]